MCCVYTYCSRVERMGKTPIKADGGAIGEMEGQSRVGRDNWMR